MGCYRPRELERPKDCHQLRGQMRQMDSLLPERLRQMDSLLPGRPRQTDPPLPPELQYQPELLRPPDCFHP